MHAGQFNATVAGKVPLWHFSLPPFRRSAAQRDFWRKINLKAYGGWRALDDLVLGAPTASSEFAGKISQQPRNPSAPRSGKCSFRLFKESYENQTNRGGGPCPVLFNFFANS
jgi:hypothetical protein